MVARTHLSVKVYEHCLSCLRWKSHHISAVADPMYRRLTLLFRLQILKVNLWEGGLGSSVGYGLDGPGIESWWGRDFSHTSCTMGNGSFPGVKRPGRGADHPPPPSAEVKVYSRSRSVLGRPLPF
jgi:hypothetical protein